MIEYLDLLNRVQEPKQKSLPYLAILIGKSGQSHFVLSLELTFRQTFSFRCILILLNIKYRFKMSVSFIGKGMRIQTYGTTLWLYLTINKY